ncbi:MAG: hypothetical protein J6C23_04030 [Clostridia bacterium]|nr:hypothetical protein [Clostridia bacterium]
MFEKLGYMLEKPKQIGYIDMTDRFVGAQTEYILNFTNNIIKITQNGETYYFREAKPHCSSLKECVISGVKSFFSEVIVNPELEKKVLTELKSSANMRKIINIGSKEKHGSNFNKYLTSGDEKYIGFFTADSADEKKTLRALAFYLYGEINSHNWNVRVKSGDLQTYTAIRTLGVTALADLLGIGEVVSGSKFVKICINGRIKYGVLENNAQGSAKTDVACEDRMKRITPAFLRSITNLNVLDFISCDTDHRVGNYHVVDEKDEYVCVISYDNDSPPTFRVPFLRVVNPMNYSKLITKNGLVNRVAIDKDLAKTVLDIDRKKLRVLDEFLSPIQVFLVLGRIKKLKKAILKTVNSRNVFLLEKDEWTKEHVSEDLCGRYGKTYLCSFVTDVYYKDGLHEFDKV